MIAAELRGGDKPSLNEALGWIGSRVDDLYGVPIGRLEDVWIDPATGEPRWLLVKEGRFGGRSTLVPFDDATPGEGAVWIPYERDIVREAPQVEPAVPLTQQLEATLRDHYAANAAAAVSHGARTSGPTPERPEPDDNGAPGATVRLRAPDTGPEPVPPPRLPERPPPPVTPPPAGEERFPFPPPRPPAEEAAAPRQRFEDEPPAAAPAQPPQPSAQPYRPPAQPQRDEPPAPDPLAALAGLPPGHVVEIELAGGVKITGELRRVRIVPGERES